jgi:hypothetical protein
MVYCVNERSSLLCVGQKHKMKVFSFLGGLSGFSLKKDLSFPESPRVIFSTNSSSGCLIIGFKKHYESLDMHSFAPTKLLDFEREHKLVCVEVRLNICCDWLCIHIWLLIRPQQRRRGKCPQSFSQPAHKVP